MIVRHGDKTIAHVNISVNGNPMKENRTNNSLASVFLKNGDEYSIVIKNMTLYPMLAEIQIDGEDITKSGELIIHGGKSVNLERFIDRSVKFKAVRKSESGSESFGKPTGLIKVSLKYTYAELTVSKYTRYEIVEVPVYVPKRRVLPYSPWVYPYEPGWPPYRPYYWTCDTSLQYDGKIGDTAVFCSAANNVSSISYKDDNPLTLTAQNVKERAATVDGGISDQNINQVHCSDSFTDVTTVNFNLFIEEKHTCNPEYVYCPECGKKTEDGCERCGTRLPENAKFCPGCGRAIK